MLKPQVGVLFIRVKKLEKAGEGSKVAGRISISYIHVDRLCRNVYDMIGK